MNRSPLHDIHVQLGARMVEFAGWLMPLMYRSIVDEHNVTRTSCSAFDVSHMGRLKITGDDAFSLLQRLCTRNLDGMEPGVCRYTHICRADGGILDDVIVSRYDGHWGIVCNASNRDKIVGWVRKHAQGRRAELEDQTIATAMIALQGPHAVERTRALLPVDLSGVKRYRFTSGVYMMTAYSIFRSGYTGEDGYEIVVPAGVVKMVASRLLGPAGEPDQGIKPAGLGARDTLRLEAAMPLYGHELHEGVDSLSAGQGWCVDLDKDFIGADPMRSLKESGLKQTLVGLELDGRRTARHRYRVRSGQRDVGEITSGCLSPTLGRSIAMAYVGVNDAEEGTELTVDFNGKPNPARVVKLPFYRRP
ncbi:MAG: glycine cleavage system aminomethyltransferase GcvT [Phycisphaerales bacterium]|nr:MAG: glycine cleavage system aminomethyltransferase GcvT [Phycisphaerales bacterium]